MVNELLKAIVSGSFSAGGNAGVWVGWFSSRKIRRAPPSDVEIRMRCLEASTRIASAELGNGATSGAVAQDVIQIADVYFAYVKGIAVRSNLRPVLEQQKMAARVLSQESSTS